MKKFISLIMSFVLVGLCIVSAMAVAENGDYSTGLIPESWEEITNNSDETTLSAFATVRTGDISGDGKISAVDARQCLQLAANMQLDINLKQEKAADVNGDGKVSSIDARTILQMAAGVTTKDTVVTADSAWGVIIGPLQSSGSTAYFWQYEAEDDGLTVDEKIFQHQNDPEIIGGKGNQYFIFTPEKSGTYTINFKFANANQTEVLDEFNVILTVTE